jgi:hypothetical protein
MIQYLWLLAQLFSTAAGTPQRASEPPVNRALSSAVSNSSVPIPWLMFTAYFNNLRIELICLDSEL